MNDQEEARDRQMGEAHAGLCRNELGSAAGRASSSARRAHRNFQPPTSRRRNSSALTFGLRLAISEQVKNARH